MDKKLLLVEDDFLVANMLGQMLTKSGFCCDHASDESEALKLFNCAYEANEPYDLVVVDLVLGENAVAGASVMISMRKIHPQVKSILCSGFTSSPIVENFKKYGFDYCLPKPFSWKSLKSFLGEQFSSQEAS